MSFSIKIVDNNTGEVGVEHTDARGIMCVVGLSDCTRCVSMFRGNAIDLYGMVEALQHLLIQTNEKHPELDTVGKVIELKKTLDDLTSGGKSGD